MSEPTTTPQRTVSEKQLIANRNNAQKSTGPRTPEGKARSSKNAVRHGILAKQLLYFSAPEKNDPNAADLGPDESYEEYVQLLDALKRDYDPQNTLEQLLVERVAACYWRLRRAYRFETLAILSTNARSRDQEFARNQMPAKDDFDKLIRYETMIDRELHRCMSQLNRLKAATTNQSAPADPPDAPRSVDSQPKPAPPAAPEPTRPAAAEPTRPAAADLQNQKAPNEAISQTPKNFPKTPNRRFRRKKPRQTNPFKPDSKPIQTQCNHPPTPPTTRQTPFPPRPAKPDRLR